MEKYCIESCGMAPLSMITKRFVSIHKVVHDFLDSNCECMWRGMEDCVAFIDRSILNQQINTWIDKHHVWRFFNVNTVEFILERVSLCCNQWCYFPFPTVPTSRGMIMSCWTSMTKRLLQGLIILCNSTIEFTRSGMGLLWSRPMNTLMIMPYVRVLCLKWSLVVPPSSYLCLP